MTLKPSTDPKERDLTTTTSEVKQIEMDQLLGQGFGTPNPPLTLHLKSTLLGEERRIYVQLPEGARPILSTLSGSARTGRGVVVRQCACPRPLLLGLRDDGCRISEDDCCED